MIRALGLSLYGTLAASTRYRLGQFVPGLAQHGIELEIRPLLRDDYLRQRFSGDGVLPIGSMLKAGFARMADLRDPGFDLAILQCELFPLMPGWLERSLLAKRPYLYDFDDAFYLKYRSGRLGALRPLLDKKFDTVMRNAAAVTPGNRVLDQYASALNPNSTILPTVVDTQRYVPGAQRKSSVFTVGWIGSPSTAPYLGELIAPLSELGCEGPVRLVVIGGKCPDIPGIEIREISWDETTEVELIGGFDVGVMPLPDDDWARGKCAFKLIQYMACAVPVIGSPVGANIDVIDSSCGFLASSKEEWLGAFRELRDNTLRAREMGEAGRARVVQHYSLSRNLPILAEVIHHVAQRSV